MQAKIPALIFYLCDMKKCENCSGRVQGLCHHTSDKAHAKYKNDSRREFEQHGLFLFEKESDGHGTVR